MARRTFSIITVSHDQGPLLKGAIESVVCQGVDDVEHIIVERGTSPEAAAIAQEYPHVVFFQEDFVHESQALNLALSVASGEIVSFLAPGERLCADALRKVAEQIDRHPVVMGAVSLTNQSGDVVERVENTERSWFDSLKYWVARALPIRVGVFFKREVLRELGIDGGDTFDEGLRFVPDFDLWLRIQERHPLSLRVPHVVATSPVNYSKVSNGYQRELSRLFRRHCARRVHPEQTLSFVVECSEQDPLLDPFVEGINSQNASGLEVVLVDGVGTRGSYERLCSRVSGYEAKYRDLSFQVVATHTDPESRVVPLDRGIRAAGALFVACIAPCDDLPVDFVSGVFRAFSRDEVGLLLPRLEKRVRDQLFAMKHGTAVFNPTGTFSFSSNVRVDWIARKVAWLDCGGRLSHDKLLEREFVIKRLMIMMAHKAWRIVHDALLADVRQSPAVLDEQPFRLYVNSLVVDELARELRRSPFSIARAHHGFGLVLSDDLWQAAQEIIQNIPEVSLEGEGELSIEKLAAIIRARPAYGPAHYALSKALRENGDVGHAAAARARWEQLHEEEKSSPLYGVDAIAGAKRS